MPSIQDTLNAQQPCAAFDDATRLRWLKWAHGRVDGADVYPHISVGPTSTVIWSQASGLELYAIDHTFETAIDRAIHRSIEEGKFTARPAPVYETWEEETFVCPNCGSHWFGSAFEGTNSQNFKIIGRECHDQFGVGCRWKGTDDTECFKLMTVSNDPNSPHFDAPAHRGE